MSQMNFTVSQQSAIFHEGGDLLVAAAAGSGKTRVLVQRLLEEISKGKNINQFLIITYTRAAAAELKSRILEELGKLEAHAPSPHIRRQSALLYHADIGTIHSIFGKFLRDFAHKLNISPDFRQADEQQTRQIKIEALEHVFEQYYEALHPGCDFEALLGHFNYGRDDSTLFQAVLALHETCKSHPNPKAWANSAMEHFNTQGKKDLSQSPWGAYLLAHTMADAKAFHQEMSTMRRGFDSVLEEKKYTADWDSILAHLHRLIEACQSGWDATSAFFPAPLNRAPSLPAGTYPREKALRERVKDALKNWEKIFSETSKEAFADMEISLPAVKALFALVFDFEDAYQKEKSRLGILDFSDLEHLSLQLLLNPETGAGTEEALEIASRYTEMMIDEFQDVSALQDTLFRCLSQMGARRFMVGDVKQSIYRFRLADPGIFLSYYRKFPEFDPTHPGASTPQQNRKVLLANNFRSHPGILDATNFLFSQLMSEKFGEMTYGAKESLYPGTPPDDTKKKETVIQLDVLDFAQMEKDETDSYEMTTARHVADEILRLQQENGYCFGDFAILLRGHSKRILFEKALEERNIPLQKGEAEAFFFTEEVATVVSLLQIILNPQRDVPLIGVLRSSLFSFSPDELAHIRLTTQEGSFYQALKVHGQNHEKSAQFLEKLHHWRSTHPDMLAHEFLYYLLNETHANSIFQGKTGGNNLQALIQLAQEMGKSSLFDFSAYLERLIEENRSPRIGDTAKGKRVQIMTMHKSKGLEFPVVFLPNLEKPFNKEDSKKPVLTQAQLGLSLKLQDNTRKIRYDTIGRHAIGHKIKEENRAEELRVLYVAMTRAKERLIMTTALKNAESSLEKLSMKTTSPPSPHILRDCQCMGEWVLLAALLREDAGAIRFGEDIPLVSTNYPWLIRKITCQGADLAALHAKKASAQEEVLPLIAPSPAFVSAMEYVYPHFTATNLPSKITATQMKGRNLDSEVLEEAQETSPQGFTPIFKKPSFIEATAPITPVQKGVLTHLVMQFIDFQKTGSLEEIKREIERLVQTETIPPEANSSVDPAVILSFFQSPLGVQCKNSPLLQREFKFSILAPAKDLGFDDRSSQILLQGVVDLFWESPQGIVVLDFKTDYVPPGKVAEKAALYRGQMQTYAYALEKITGKPVAKVLLYFFSTGESVGLEY